MSQSTFARFAPRLQEAIAARLGWTELRPVQELAGAAILEGKNAVVLAPTAGGKTEASMFPLLSMLVSKPVEAVGALYLAPIKALLNNQADRLGLYAEMVGLNRFLWHGDVPQNRRKQFLDEPAELLMTTPECLEVMLVSQKVSVQKLFADLRIVVIDEVHALAGIDRGAHLMSVLERITDVSRHDVQRIGLSATVGNPDAIVTWLRGTSERAGVVIAPPKQPQARTLAVHLDTDIVSLANHAAGLAKEHKSMFFCESRALTESIADRMRDRGTEVFVHHSSVSLEERELAEQSFQHGGDASIVCTSTLELGIDVGDLDLVFQANAPSDSCEATTPPASPVSPRSSKPPSTPACPLSPPPSPRLPTDFAEEPQEVPRRSIADVRFHDQRAFLVPASASPTGSHANRAASYRYRAGDARLLERRPVGLLITGRRNRQLSSPRGLRGNHRCDLLRRGTSASRDGSSKNRGLRRAFVSACVDSSGGDTLGGVGLRRPALAKPLRTCSARVDGVKVN